MRSLGAKANSFAELLGLMWDDAHSAVSPSEIKDAQPTRGIVFCRGSLISKANGKMLRVASFPSIGEFSATLQEFSMIIQNCPAFPLIFLQLSCVFIKFPAFPTISSHAPCISKYFYTEIPVKQV